MPGTIVRNRRGVNPSTSRLAGSTCFSNTRTAFPCSMSGCTDTPLDGLLILEAGRGKGGLLPRLVAGDEQRWHHSHSGQRETGVHPQIDGGPGGRPSRAGVASRHHQPLVPRDTSGEQHGAAPAVGGPEHDGHPVPPDRPIAAPGRNHDQSNGTVPRPAQHRGIGRPRHGPGADRKVTIQRCHRLDEFLDPRRRFPIDANGMDQGDRLRGAGGRQARRLGHRPEEVIFIAQSHPHTGADIGREPGDPRCERGHDGGIRLGGSDHRHQVIGLQHRAAMGHDHVPVADHRHHQPVVGGHIPQRVATDRGILHHPKIHALSQSPGDGGRELPPAFEQRDHSPGRHRIG